jgi:hypothetical protein
MLVVPTGQFHLLAIRQINCKQVLRDTYELESQRWISEFLIEIREYLAAMNAKVEPAGPVSQSSLLHRSQETDRRHAPANRDAII